MRKIFKNPVFIMLLDMTLMYLCFIAVFSVRFFDGGVPGRNMEAFHQTKFYIMAVFLLLLYVQGLYDFDETDDGVSIFFKVFSVIGAGTVSIMALTFLNRAFAFPRTVVFMSYFILLAFISVWRLFVHKSFLESLSPREAVVYGNREWFGVVEGYLKKCVRKYRFNGGVEKGNVDELMKLVDKNGAECVIITDEVDGSHELAFEILMKKPEIIVYVLPRVADIISGVKPHLVIGDWPLIAFSNKAIIGRFYLMKRVMDFILSLTALLLLSPLFIIVAVCIKITSRGPVFYMQSRVGKNGKEFNIIKFRTMKNDAEEYTGPVLSSGVDDPRSTSIGKYLRRFKIDEMPQFINVLKGEMSVVGPRPERPVFVTEFEKTYPGYSQRKKVHPGITGLAQVNGLYESDASIKLKYDLIYIHNYSPVMDLAILYQTFQFVIRDNI